MATYLPTREADLFNWASNFNDLITAGPGPYGLTVAQATAYNALFVAFRDAYIASSNASTRTAPAVQAKNTAKAALVSGPGGIRELVNIVQSAPGTTNQMRSDLQITIRDSEPTPVPAPVDPPEMDIQAVLGRTVRIRLHNDTVLQRRKPVGVQGASVFSYVGETAPDDINDWKFEFSTSVTTVEVVFDAAVPAGSRVWLTAFWFNRKMESGPACLPTSTHIAGGLQQAA